jgi:hypothetical protein
MAAPPGPRAFRRKQQEQERQRAEAGSG